MLTTFFALLLSLVTTSQAQVLRLQPVEGDIQARGQFDYTSTKANYPLGGGSSYDLVGGKLQRMIVSGELGYSLSNQIRAWAGVNGGQTTANVINNALSVTDIVSDTHTNSGLNEGWAGAQYWLMQSNLSIVPELDLVFPFWRVNQNSNDPLLGEGAMRIQGGVWLLMDFSSAFMPFAYSGYAYRDEGRASLFPYDLGVRYTVPHKWYGQLEFRGFESVTDDSASGTYDRALRDGYLTRVDGGSYELYAINPGRGDVVGTVGFTVQQITMYVGAYKSVYGHSSADSWGATVGFTFDSEIGAKRHKKKGGGFTDDPVRYNEKVFDEPVTPTVYEPIDEPAPPPPPPPKPKPAPRKKRGDEPMPNVEMLMKDTQKTLEKRGN